MSHNADSHGHSHAVGHILPKGLYLGILIWLLGLTFATVLLSEKAGVFHFGAWAILVAMVIASIKALSVALYFMHLKYENPLTWLYAIFPLVLLFFLIGGVFLDNPFRIDGRTGKTTVYGETIVPAAPGAPTSEHGK